MQCVYGLFMGICFFSLHYSQSSKAKMGVRDTEKVLVHRLFRLSFHFNRSLTFRPQERLVSVLLRHQRRNGEEKEQDIVCD